MNFTEYKEKLANLTKQIEEMHSELGNEIVRTLFKEAFVEMPKVQAFRWAQYTPYFADGEACVFSIGELQVKLRDGSYEDFDASDSEYDEGFNGAWSLRKIDIDLHDKMECLSEKLNELETTLLAVFGDHQMITVYPDRIQAEEHEHD